MDGLLEQAGARNSEAPEGREYHRISVEQDSFGCERHNEWVSIEISLDDIFGNTADKGYGLIMGIGPDEFLGAGSGFRVSFVPDSPGPVHAGINFIEDGRMMDGAWRPGRRLNGDENDQGRYWRFSTDRIHIERSMVYRWE